MIHPAYAALSFTVQESGLRQRAWKLLGRLSSGTEKQDESSQGSCLEKVNEACSKKSSNDLAGISKRGGPAWIERRGDESCVRFFS